MCTAILVEETFSPTRDRLRAAPGSLQDATSARAQLEATLCLDARNAGSTYMSAASLLAAYRYPEVQDTESTTDLSAQAFLDGSDGQANTLYIVAGADDQERLAPIIVSILSEIMAVGNKRAAREGCALLAPDGGPAGAVTSGSFAPWLDKSVAMGYVARTHAALAAQPLDPLLAGEVVFPPFHTVPTP